MKIKRIIGRLKRNYYVEKARLNFSFIRSSLRGKAPLIVYQMGKVGSSTVVESLKASDPDRYVYQVHYLTHKEIDTIRNIYYGQSSGILNKRFLTRSKHLLESEYLRKQLDKGINGQKWKIVTLVREPVARNMSSFFQILDLSLPDYVKQYQNGSLDTENLIDRFLNDHELQAMPLSWFDTQLKAVFDIDVFAHEFPASKGYQIIEGDYADVLLLRLENLNEVSERAFKEFLDIDNFSLVKANIARNKDYYSAYKDVVNAIELPDSYLDKMYTAKYTRHFYGDDEISRFKAKWSARRT